MARALSLRRARKNPGTLLCIDDQAQYLPMRKAFLESHGFEVFTAASGQEGLELLAQRKIDGVIVDYHMPGMNGAEVAREIRRSLPNLPIIMLSGWPHQIPPHVRAVVNAVVVKGDGASALLQALEAVLPNVTLKRPPTTASTDSIPQTREQIRRVREATAERRRAIGRKGR